MDYAELVQHVEDLREAVSALMQQNALLEELKEFAAEQRANEHDMRYWSVMVRSVN